MTPRLQNWYAEIAVAILLVVLVILSVFLVRQYKVTAREGVVSSERIHFAAIAEHHSLGTADASLIEPWMTFGYVSISFKVPVGYLASALGIGSSTSGYPNITIGRYARTVATSSEALTQAVRDAVQGYLAPTGK